MSIYAINKMFYTLENDAAFRQRMLADPTKAMDEYPITEPEMDALTRGDVEKLFQMGVHPFLLNSMSRLQLFGVNRDNYLPRIGGSKTGLGR